MPSFIDQRIRQIFQNASIEIIQTPALSTTNQESKRQRNLKSILFGLHRPPNDQQLRKSLVVLDEGAATGVNDPVTIGISERVIAGLYARAMEEMLQQALEADLESQFWRDIERSDYDTAWFLVQTIPLRLQRLFAALFNSLRNRNIPITLSTFRLDNLRRLFPTTTRPSELLIAAFPHLNARHRFFSTSPFALIQDECRLKRKQLEALRDDRALRVGLLASASHDLEHTMSTTHSAAQINRHIALLQTALILDQPSTGFQPTSSLDYSMLDELVECKKVHTQEFSALKRPSRWVRVWPRFLLIPPATYLFVKYAYGSQSTFAQHVHEAWMTAKVFWESWVLEPLRGILATVRTGGEDGVRVIPKDALRADLESLERMAMALGQEKLGYTPEQLHALHDQVQRGDLTLVLKVYEEDIKSPIRSAIGGTLIRSLLIQIQKMKVDVDFALSGIDKLLRSQELTFGFVGVAPALAVVYLSFSWVWQSWKGGNGGHGKFGGKKERAKVWNTIRRIEKLLISPPRLGPSSPLESSAHLEPLLQSYKALGMGLGLASPSASTKNRSKSNANDLPNVGQGVGGAGAGAAGDSSLLSPLANGLLLLASTHLRAFAEKRLKRSGFRDEFLDDVSDLEDDRLTGEEKRLVLERMWRNWGKVLGWDNLADL
ncbi:hypothetical protein M408DRAFT_66872 [Serendipita vermifera MAFF 305830]|uniref:NCA2-domain-containing protein n=1 Tax=Serendipita vermifera MAFF 305830 TaxID=933852 RepID=A0A0C2WV59_SERVB|nr:hypothetical protein M408DRAFT_66872 [Serendipita vermifera MAFF 305830]